MTDKKLTLNEILENGMAELNEKMEKRMIELKEEMKKGIAELTAKINAKIEADEQQNGGGNGNNENERKRKIFEEDEPNSKKKQSYLSTHQRRGLPAELLNELFSSLMLEKAFGLLSKMPNGLLARNLQKILENIKMEMKVNKWNVEDCVPKLAISEDGLVIEHTGPNDFNSIRSVSSIPTIHLGINKSIIICYFEVEILTVNWYGIRIGFSTQQFPLDDMSLGIGNENSIGIYQKKEMQIDGNNIFGDEDGCFVKGSVVGIGVIQSPKNDSMQCFSTCNGQLLVKGELPSKFSTLELYPTVSLRYGGQSIRANFGKEKWQFKQFDKVLAYKGKYKELMNLNLIEE